MKIVNVVSFDKILEGLIGDVVDQKINLFNEASGNAISMVGIAGRGSFEYQKFVKDISDAAGYRRDIKGSATVTAADYAEDEKINVSIAGGFYVAIPSSILAWRGEGDASAEVAAAITEIGRQYAEYILKDQLNSALAAVVGAATANTDTYFDGSAAQITLSTVSDTFGKFGDAQDKIKVLVMESSAFNKLRKDAIGNATSLFSISNISIYDATYLGLGVKVLVTDSPALLIDDTTDLINVVAIQEYGVMVSDFTGTMMAQKVAGKENISEEFQANYKFTLGLKGYTWDATNGGISPTDAAIATGTNWDQIAKSYKNTAAVVGTFLK